MWNEREHVTVEMIVCKEKEEDLSNIKRPEGGEALRVYEKAVCGYA